MSEEILGRDVSGVVDFSLPAPTPNSCWDSPLVANVVATTTTPANFNRAFFSFAIGTNVWVTMDGTTPIVPSARTTSQELNPGCRQISIGGAQTLKFISDTASFVNIRYDRGT